jgi:hypothetical protein
VFGNIRGGFAVAMMARDRNVGGQVTISSSCARVARTLPLPR